MTLEEIVRALAERGAPTTDPYGDCALCTGQEVTAGSDNLADHDEDCPWRQAREWIKEATKRGML